VNVNSIDVYPHLNNAVEAVNNFIHHIKSHTFPNNKIVHQTKSLFFEIKPDTEFVNQVTLLMSSFIAGETLSHIFVIHI